MKDPRAEVLQSSLIVEDGDVVLRGGGGRMSLTVRHPETEEKATVVMTDVQASMLSSMLTGTMSGDEDF